MALISVTQYAKKTGKDVGNIRRLLASGRLPGFKVGNQWVIDENTDYPKDRRIKSGKYKNWRQRVLFYSNKLLSKTVEDIIEELRNIYGDYLSEVILYGSYARGEQSEESDVDIAIILDSGYSKEMQEAMIECVAKKELECSRVISVVDIDHSNYLEWKDELPFYKNVEKEGIVLWKKAS